ncbi:MAG TPA: helix-turn-helix transcriptional regulator [Candidatus Udaeobacter sp.]|nr:helix-turn-helix transcriptional regulator [Candidatus Udaeobacter sp.]
MHSVSEYDQRSVEAFASLKLTPREAEVLFWISQGKSNHDIGVILGAKTATIRKHVEHIFAKLNVENRTAAAVTALETCRFLAPRAKSDGSQPWAAIGGLIATVLQDLCSDAWEIYDAVSVLVA